MEMFDDDDDERQLSSEDSLENSFKETELASDDEEAEQQVRKAKDANKGKRVNEQALNLLENDDVE